MLLDASIQEVYPHERTPYGWETKVTLFGRIYWQDLSYGLVSYEQPCRTDAVIWDDGVLSEWLSMLKATKTT
jgi:hypothetical protein